MNAIMDIQGKTIYKIDDRGRAFIAKQSGLVVEGVPAFLKYRNGFLVDRDPGDRTVTGLAAFMAM